MRWARDGWAVELQLENGQPPDWVQNEPEIYIGDDFYLLAFNELSTCRQVGMGIGPIPWNCIMMYAEAAGLDGELKKSFRKIIRKLDATYLDWAKKNREQEPSND